MVESCTKQGYLASYSSGIPDNDDPGSLVLGPIPRRHALFQRGLSKPFQFGSPRGYHAAIGLGPVDRFGVDSARLVLPDEDLSRQYLQWNCESQLTKQTSLYFS